MTSNLEVLSLLHEFNSYGSYGSDEFIKFCGAKLTPQMCRQMQLKTTDQSRSELWYKLRHGRITASVFHEAANCQTNGSLVQVDFREILNKNQGFIFVCEYLENTGQWQLE